MMILSARRGDASVVEYLEYHARTEPIRWLVGRMIVAFTLVLGGFGPLSVAKPVVVTLALAYFSYGAWGLLDRARSYSTIRGWTLTAVYLRLLCAFFVGIGVLSGVGLLMALGFLLLGAPWQL